MKHDLIATAILVSAAAVAATTAGNASSAAAGACRSKEATIKGKSVIVACGPASAKLQYKGKTYAFKSGTCFRSAAGVVLSLGTSLVNNTNGNGGFTQFSITLLPKPASGTSQITADDGTLHLVAFSATNSKVAVTGTFKGTNNAAKAVPFTGSWNCGGAIYKF
jgi:hypothetical protein